nr:MAG TPA: hypothetical protein [Caudoviricetes sp.]
MNKEQQIVEFQNDIIDNLFDGGTYKLAEALYNAGYRKISEDNICEAVEKPVNTPKRKYESIEDIVRGFIVKDGKILYVTNILDGCRHEFKDIHEICDEMNAMMKQLDSLTELSDYLKAMNKEIRDNTAQEILSQLAKMANRETPLKADIEELAEKWGVEVKQ